LSLFSLLGFAGRRALETAGDAGLWRVVWRAPGIAPTLFRSHDVRVLFGDTFARIIGMTALVFGCIGTLVGLLT
jgi:hypothetical protein